MKLHRSLLEVDGAEVVETVCYGLPGADMWVARNVSDRSVDMRTLIFEEQMRVFQEKFPAYTFEV